MIEFKLPSLGADMDAGKLLEWRVAPGQAVKKGDVLAVVDTSKAAIDVEIWVDGTVQQLITEVGQTVAVGTVMALLLAPGEAAPSTSASQEPAPPAASGEVAPDGARPPSPSMPAPPAAQACASLRRRISPAARQRAAELGLSLDGPALAGLPGSGAGGALTRGDVERAANPARPSDADQHQQQQQQRALEMRKAIAAAMARSKREIPHYHLIESLPMRKALEWLQEHNQTLPITQRLLLAVLLLKAVALALHETPELNGWYVDGAFRPADKVHVGVAISLRQGGLIAPALHDVAAKPLDLLMAELADLVARARSASLRSSELADPTITVTHLGEQGVEAVLGIIHPPQVALVGFGRVADRPWIDEGRIIAMPVLTASLAADHRVSDGHRGALFLLRLRELLQQPQLL